MGKQGNVLKLTAFQRMQEHLYNMALVDYDLETEEGNDSIVTNNQDMPKVLATVARILFDFLTCLPHVAVLIEANSEIKKKLYNRLIKNNLQSIPIDCEVLGVLPNEETELFAENDYHAIIIRNKNYEKYA